MSSFIIDGCQQQALQLQRVVAEVHTAAQGWFKKGAQTLDASTVCEKLAPNSGPISGPLFATMFFGFCRMVVLCESRAWDQKRMTVHTAGALVSVGQRMKSEEDRAE